MPAKTNNPSLSKLTKTTSFIKFTKTKNPAVQECYSLKTKYFRDRLRFDFQKQPPEAFCKKRCS